VLFVMNGNFIRLSLFLMRKIGPAPLNHELTDNPGWAVCLRNSRRVVIKLGTRVVTGQDGTSRDLKHLVSSIARLVEQGRQVTLVSSGAVGLGARHLAVAPIRTRDLAMRQACAAVGQSLLMQLYERLFARYGVTVAQVLVTEDDFRNRIRYLNLRRTFEKLLKLGVLPIVNENDTVSTVELEYKEESSGRAFSDNDRLAALVMSKLEADALLLLTNVEGLLSHGRVQAGSSPSFEVVSLVRKVTPEIRALATASFTQGGRGGMSTKIQAAEIAMNAGRVAVIASGKVKGVVDRIFAGEAVGTVFFPESLHSTRMNGKRRWLAYAADVRGLLTVNEGARKAIVDGKASLLASGVVRIERAFESSDIVSISDSLGKEFARGVVNLSSDELEALIKTGAHLAPVLVTRNNILVLQTNDSNIN